MVASARRLHGRHMVAGYVGRTARVALAGVGVTLALLIGSASAASSSQTLYVDCTAPLGGNGSKQAPFSTITAALPSARALSAGTRVTISIATGVCDKETLPIELDFPVDLRGSRAPDLDGAGFPLGTQDRDTLVTWTPPSPVPPAVLNLAFIRVTGADVRVSKLSIDGKIVPGAPGGFGAAATAPMGLLASGASDFVFDQLRIVRLRIAVRAQGSSGRVRDSYFGTLGDGFALIGGDPASVPTVVVSHNRIEDYWTGAFAVGGTSPIGRAIRVVIEGNDTVTSYADTGPSNPFGVRVGPILLPPFLQGSVDAVFQNNTFRGSPRYAIILNGTQTVRRSDGQHYSGNVNATFADNEINEAGVTRAVSLITFTNSRATELPCELNPANTPLTCPTLAGNPLQYWEYLEASTFDLHHSGELSDPRIDHPATEPVGGRVLNNVLRINDVVAPNETFVVVP